MRTLSKIVLFSATLALGPGCVLTHPTDPYTGMTRGMRHASGSRFPSTATRPVQGPLTLDDAIGLALANNHEVAATTSDLDAARAERDLAAGQRLPSLHALGGYNHHMDSQRLLFARENGQAGLFSRDLFSGELVLSLPLFTGGRITSEIEAAELLQDAAEHRLARTREQLVFDVSSVFLGILAQREVIASLEFSKTALQEHLNRVKDLIAAQKAAKVDQLRTEVRMADLEQRLAGERNILAVQARLLTNLLGLESSAEPAGELAPARTEAAGTDQALRRAYGGRGDYLAARAALEAQARAVDAARAGFWPTVALQGAYGGRWAAEPTDRPSGTESFEDVGRVGVVVDLPLFDGGRIEARVRQEKARLQAAQERLRQLELKVRLDVETAVLNIGSSARRVEAMEKAIEQARESLRIERQKYELGKGAIVDVLDAQSALLDSQTSYIRALADYNVALAQLRLATGDQ